jgi:hypothetical protein
VADPSLRTYISVTLLDRESRYIGVRSDSLSHFAKGGEPHAPDWKCKFIYERREK